MLKYLEDHCEGIDAALFSGDALWDDAQREEFQAYLERWARAVAERLRERGVEGAAHVDAPTSGVLQPSVTDSARASLQGWTCFHCGETFTTVGDARTHFGAQPDAEPGCMVRVSLGAERGLLMALRKTEDECRAAWASVHEETTDAQRAMAAMQTRHSDALQQAEEAGYERGLRYAREQSLIALREWAVSRWRAEVQHRPLVNVHRRTLDNCWRQVLRYAGLNPDEVVGPAHDVLRQAQQEL